LQSFVHPLRISKNIGVATVKETQLVKGKDLDGNEKVLEKTHPYQLELFQYLLPDEDRYSNTLELYDATPRFFPSPKKMASLRENGRFLDTLRRPFWGGSRDTCEIVQDSLQSFTLSRFQKYQSAD
jgi:hypothetical protein